MAIRDSEGLTVGLINRKQEDDDELPGSGVSVDLDTKVCPSCRREAMPWEDTCPECGSATVAPDEVPASEIPLPPGLAAIAEEERNDRADTDADADR